ncbi:unnamed protein product [Dibothriocephalus latus]|uniref:Uncharacterized protein n=1 Tax=Dibothriocephalus latus TaxID=60516 RepID=A0A3P6UAK0_DIBLA|nr:unnamed protein product [Dibothriocephalus latus]
MYNQNILANTRNGKKTPGQFGTMSSVCGLYRDVMPTPSPCKLPNQRLIPSSCVITDPYSLAPMCSELSRSSNLAGERTFNMIIKEPRLEYRLAEVPLAMKIY